MTIRWLPVALAALAACSRVERGEAGAMRDAELALKRKAPKGAALDIRYSQVREMPYGWVSCGVVDGVEPDAGKQRFIYIVGERDVSLDPQARRVGRKQFLDPDEIVDRQAAFEEGWRTACAPLKQYPKNGLTS